MKKWNNPEIITLNISETAGAPAYRQPDGTCGRVLQPTPCPITNGVGRCNNCKIGGTSGNGSDNNSGSGSDTGSNSDNETDFTS